MINKLFYVKKKKSIKCSLPKWATKFDFDMKIPVVEFKNLKLIRTNIIQHYIEIKDEDENIFYIQLIDLLYSNIKREKDNSINLSGNYLVQIINKKTYLTFINDLEEFQNNNLIIKDEIHESILNLKEKRNLIWSEIRINYDYQKIFYLNGEILLNDKKNKTKKLLSKTALKLLKGKLNIIKLNKNELVFKKFNLKEYSIFTLDADLTKVFKIKELKENGKDCN